MSSILVNYSAPTSVESNTRPYNFNVLTLLSSESGSNYWCDDAVQIMARYANVHIIHYDALYMKLGKAGLELYIRNYVATQHIDVTYYFTDNTYTFDIDFIHELRDTTFVVLHSGDDELLFDIHARYYGQVADLVVTCDYLTTFKYRQLGINSYYSACPFDKTRYPYVRLHKNIDVSFVGPVPGKVGRQNLLQCLRDEGVDVFLPGGWERSVRIPFSGMLDVFARSKINLNFTGVSTDHFLTRGHNTLNRIGQVKGRPVEVALTGSFVLTEYVPGIEQYFEIGKEIDTFSSADELLAKVQYYLGHDEEREIIARRGYERVIRDHEGTVGVPRVLAVISELIRQKTRSTRDIYLDDVFIRNYNSYRASRILRFLKKRKWRFALEELQIMWRLKKIDLRHIYGYIQQELITTVEPYPRLKNALRDVRGKLRGLTP